MEKEKALPDYSVYNLKSQTNVIIHGDKEGKFNFWIGGEPDDQDDKFGTVFMFDDEMLKKLQELIAEHIGD